MTRCEIAVLRQTSEKPNVMIRDGRRVVAHGDPIEPAIERISRKLKCSSGGHADTGPWAN
jgi:hypothetical protein